MLLTNDILDECRRRLGGGEADEAIVAWLRQIGLGKVATMKVFVELKRASVAEAKRLVHYSPTWSDTREEDERFHESVERFGSAKAGVDSVDSQ